MKQVGVTYTSGDQLHSAINWLEQYPVDIVVRTVREFDSFLDLLIILPNSEHNNNVFFEINFDEYIASGVPMYAIGNAALAMYSKLGGHVKGTVPNHMKEHGLLYKLGPALKWEYQTINSNHDRYPDPLIPPMDNMIFLAYSSTSSREKVISMSEDMIVKRALEIPEAFYHKTAKIAGSMFEPYEQYNRRNSQTYNKLQMHWGDPVSDWLLKRFLEEDLQVEGETSKVLIPK